MRNERVWPQQCWKSGANGSNIVALRFGDHGTKEMLGVVGWKVWPVSNFTQQHPTTCNRVWKRTQHVTSNNVGSCWPTILRGNAAKSVLVLQNHLALTEKIMFQSVCYLFHAKSCRLSDREKSCVLFVFKLLSRALTRRFLAAVHSP